jgi:hypothetical protein
MRFRRSRLLSEGSHTCWEGTLNASTPQGWGSSCLQSPGWGSAGHEDCLFLNVWSPALPEPSEAAADLLPVFFYIHGGSLVAGSGNTYFQGLKGQGLVIVTINYRLNVAGFLALDALTETDEEKASGNYGLSDQVTALRWVQKNIAQFGAKTHILLCAIFHFHNTWVINLPRQARDKHRGQTQREVRPSQVEIQPRLRLLGRAPAVPLCGTCWRFPPQRVSLRRRFR